MGGEIAALCRHRVFHHFYQISQIPRGSGDEKAVSDYVFHWARGLGLEAEQDEFCNVFVRKPPSSGFEDRPSVMLQAHLDMVCEKSAEADHDFARDPIQWAIDGDWLSTGGLTTLGADNGIGVALMMAVLEDSSLSHPALEALFTTNEEEDMSGAAGFDSGRMRARYLINLDHMEEDQVNCGSCGGMRADFHLPLEPEPIPDSWRSYRLSVSGLKGGHSGEDIHRGRGNANILLARLLLGAEGCCDFRINSIRGGSFRLALPRDAQAVLSLDPAHEEELRGKLACLERDMRAELAVTGDRLRVVLEPAQPARRGVIPGKVIDAMSLIPDGIFQMNEALTGLVDTSDNLGEVYLEGDELHLVLEIRSAQDSLRTYLYQRMERLAALLGGRCTCSRVYPSWHFHPVSPLREFCVQAYSRCYGTESPALFTVHAGLEVGYLLEQRPEVDTISIGPTCVDFHSPAERVRISSVRRFYDYLCTLLALVR